MREVKAEYISFLLFLQVACALNSTIHVQKPPIIIHTFKCENAWNKVKHKIMRMLNMKNYMYECETERENHFHEKDLLGNTLSSLSL